MNSSIGTSCPEKDRDMDDLNEARNLNPEQIDPETAERMTGLSVRETQEVLAKELDAELESALHNDAESDDPENDDPGAPYDDQTITAANDGNEADCETEQHDTIDGVERTDDVTEENNDDSDNVGEAVWSAAEAAEHLKMLEALLFAASESMDVASIKKRLPEGADVSGLLETLTQQYENRGVRLSKAGGRYQFVTSPDVAHVLTVERTETRRLSKAAMETLAIIAYHQPCTRADIEDVRGVAVSKGSIDQLLEMNWVRLAGRRRDAPGRPVLYATTKDFLEHFDLERISDLPGMADLKAAGLLEANLPPGFEIPMPADADGDGETNEQENATGSDDDPEFVQDFHGEEDDADQILEVGDTDGEVGNEAFGSNDEDDEQVL